MHGAASLVKRDHLTGSTRFIHLSLSLLDGRLLAEAVLRQKFILSGLSHRPSPMAIMIIGIFYIIAVTVERPQEVPEDPVSHLSSLLPRRFVREAEVNAL